MEVWWFGGDEPEMVASVGILSWQDDGTGRVGFMVFPCDIKGKCERMPAEKAFRGQTACEHGQDLPARRYDPEERRNPLDSTPSLPWRAADFRTQSGHKQTTKSQS